MKSLKNKKIATVRLNVFGKTSGGENAYDPEIVFHDGTVLRFVVQETNMGEYGVELVYPARSRKHT